MSKFTFEKNWKAILLKAWSMWWAWVGVFTPEVLQLISNEVHTLTWLDADAKSAVRLACLVLVIITRPMKQTS